MHWINRKQSGGGKPLIDIHLAVVSRDALFPAAKASDRSIPTELLSIKGNTLETAMESRISPTTPQFYIFVFFFSQTCGIIKVQRMFPFQTHQSATGKNPQIILITFVPCLQQSASLIFLVSE